MLSVEISATRLLLHIGHLCHNIFLRVLIVCFDVGSEERAPLGMLGLLEKWALGIFNEVCDDGHQLHYN